MSRTSRASSDIRSLVQVSEHPLAAAILARGREKGMEASAVEGFQALSGLGAEGRVQGKRCLVGNARLMKQEKIDTTSLNALKFFISNLLSFIYLNLIEWLLTI